MIRFLMWPIRLGVLCLCAATVQAGYYSNLHSPGNVPWPGGVVPYEFDPGLTAAQQQAYLDGLRDWELAANVQFVPRTGETDYIVFKYDPNGPNLVSGSQPQTVEINLLTRGQILHEMGHSFGLLHEHQRADRDTFVTICSANVDPALASEFAIDAAGVTVGAYDFHSVMHYGRKVGALNPALDTIKVKAGFEPNQELIGMTLWSPSDRAAMEALYGPPAPALSPVVTTTADGGAGSLRAALYYAADHPGTTITFNIPASDPGFSGGVWIIQPTGALPQLMTDGTIIDGTSQPGYAGKPLIVLNGSLLLPEAGDVPGLQIHAANCAVKGISVHSFPWVGIAIRLSTALGNEVSGCWCGLDATGGGAAPNAKQGIQISDGANGNVIGGTGAGEGNVLSGNTEYGVLLAGAATTGNTIQGNYIGLNCDGTAAVANGLGGVLVFEQAHTNTIGSVAAGNVISGNVSAGVWLTGAGVDNNRVEGNLVGLNATGTAAVPNTFAGMYVLAGAKNNLVLKNVFSGNTSEGCRMADPGTTGNELKGNLVGTNAAGDAAVPNGWTGLTIFNGASGNTIGGSGVGDGNLISGNASYGVVIADGGSDGNRVEGNTIGLDIGGTLLGNGFAGVAIWNGAQGNTVGGQQTGESNIIAGNGSWGIALFDPAITFGNTFSSNGLSGHGLGGISLGGGNHDQAAPVLSSSVLVAAGTTVTGNLTSTANSTFRIEFFASDPPGIGEAETYLGAINGVTTNDTGGGMGSAVINGTLGVAVPAGKVITATATDVGTGDTSALSAPVAVTTTDSDGDGMPDDYEMANGLDKNSNDAALDADGDGRSNLQEFRDGTDPQQSDDLFKVESVDQAGDDVVVTVAVVAGRVYRVEKSDTLEAGSWRVIVPFAVASGAQLQVVDPAGMLGSRGFYRAQTLP